MSTWGRWVVKVLPTSQVSEPRAGLSGQARPAQPTPSWAASALVGLSDAHTHAPRYTHSCTCSHTQTHLGTPRSPVLGMMAFRVLWQTSAPGLCLVPLQLPLAHAHPLCLPVRVGEGRLFLARAGVSWRLVKVAATQPLGPRGLTHLPFLNKKQKSKMLHCPAAQ